MPSAAFYKQLGKSPSQIFAMLRKKQRAKTGPLLINIVLRKEVDGLGKSGQLIQVHPSVMRTTLYPMKQAVYATPENVQKYALRPYRVQRMMEEEGISEEEAWLKVDEDIERRNIALQQERKKIVYPRWFYEKYPEYRTPTE